MYGRIVHGQNRGVKGHQDFGGVVGAVAGCSFDVVFVGALMLV